jgi:hypothetical protein
MMGRKTTGCKKPKNLKGDPKDCAPQQVKKCHGSGKEHTCVKPKKGE